MTGFTPEPRHGASWALVAIVTASAAVALSGCNKTTYGTGVSPGMQTIQDLAGIAALGDKKEPIDYTPRPKIVAPPDVAQLPPPGAGNTAQVASNWPLDPDVARAKIKADAIEREATGQPINPALIPRITPETDPAFGTIDPKKPLTKDEEEKLKKMFADARAGGSLVDANGNPVRQYLSDPPGEYRIPDPSAPVDVVTPTKKKKFKWWWDR